MNIATSKNKIVEVLAATRVVAKSHAPHCVLDCVRIGNCGSDIETIKSELDVMR